MLLTKYINLYNPESPLNEYPRPQFIRNSYISLNGKWDFTITKTNNIPTNYDLNIVVPYCVESCLSGICKQVSKDDYLYYRKKVVLDKSFINDKLLLHFDAIDQIANIYINNTLVKTSDNGYLPVIVDIKPYINSNEFEIVVQVIDKLDKNYPYGKQCKKRGGMWYTPVSGIWQSVWLESVHENAINNVTITPDIDNNSVSIVLNTMSDENEIIILENNK